jgi:KDO2-lipid IV(A) lauroyltransferase
MPLVQAVRANQWVVGGGGLSSSQLDRVVRDTLRHTAHSFYTLFRYIDNPAQLQSLIDYSPQVERLIESSQQGKQGLIVVGVHMGNFDLVLQATAMRGLRVLGLSLPQANETVEWQHGFRRQSGVEILPASLGNLRQAIRHLQAGGIVLTGIDRPMPDVKYRPRFFDHPAMVPVHHISLALKARVPLIVMTSILGSDGVYHVLSSDFLELQSYPDRQTEILNNAEMVLEIAADFIRQAPHQWTIFQPVWPEVIPGLP